MPNYISLKEWMDEQGYSNRQLGEELGVSYDLAYKVANGHSPMTPGFKWRFAMRFGLAEAGRIFETPPLQRSND